MSELTGNPPPLYGTHVLDFTWSLAGPQSTRYLADLGATVIKVENLKKIDPLRPGFSFKNDIPGIERSPLFHNANAGKRSICLDIKTPAGFEIVRRLAARSDVVVESFASGVIDRMGLGYAELSRDKPELIMASTSVMGASPTGEKGAPGVGTMGAAMSGATHLVGWPDRPPCGVHGAWTDGVAPKFVALAILTALWQRNTTGLGCYIDISQAETGIQFLRPAHYQFAADGTVAQRGDRVETLSRCPAGVYRCSGDDRWIALEVTDHEQWTALRSLIGGALLEPSFDLLLDRLRNRSEIDELISRWAATQDAVACEETLQAVGVPAHVVSLADDFATDTDLLKRDFLHEVAYPEIGGMTIERPRHTFDRTPNGPLTRAPKVGEHGRDILQTICGYTAEEVEQHVLSGAVYIPEQTEG